MLDVEYVTGDGHDWLGNPAPEAGAMVVGARYTLAVAPGYSNEKEGYYEFEWEFHSTAWPDEMWCVITADAVVQLRAVGVGGVPIPMTAKARQHLLEQAVHQCALGAAAQLSKEATKRKARFDLAYPDRASWPEPDYDGYSPANQSFKGLVLDRDRAQWCTSVARFLADADRVEQQHG